MTPTKPSYTPPLAGPGNDTDSNDEYLSMFVIGLTYVQYPFVVIGFSFTGTYFRRYLLQRKIETWA